MQPENGEGRNGPGENQNFPLYHSPTRKPVRGPQHQHICSMKSYFDKGNENTVSPYPGGPCSCSSSPRKLSANITMESVNQDFQPFQMIDTNQMSGRAVSKESKIR